jgi:predicted  nucleic acid-binding Zn-ribbon protein
MVEGERKLKADAHKASADLTAEVSRGKARILALESEVERWRKEVGHLQMNTNSKCPPLRIVAAPEDAVFF